MDGEPGYEGRGGGGGGGYTDSTSYGGEEVEEYVLFSLL